MKDFTYIYVYKNIIIFLIQSSFVWYLIYSDKTNNPLYLGSFEISPVDETNTVFS